MSALFCKFDVVGVTVVNSTPAAFVPVVCFDGWSKTWNLGDVYVHPAFSQKHKGTIVFIAFPNTILIIACSSCDNSWLIIEPHVGEEAQKKK